MPEDKKDERPAHLDTFIPGTLIKNPLSMVGLALAVAAFANILFLILVVGIMLERRRRVRGLSDASRFPKSTSTTRSVRGPTVIERRLCW